MIHMWMTKRSSYDVGLLQSCRPAAERELAVLLDVLSQCETKAELVGEWDLQYLCSIYRQKAYGDTHVLSK